MNLSQGIKLICEKIQYRNKIHFDNWEKKLFHARSHLSNQEKFSEKPLWLKKLKIKQAKMQKDDGLPIFLKNGFRDKVLYNLTLGMVIFSTFASIKCLYDLDHTDKK